MGWFEAPADDTRPYADIDTPTFAASWTEESSSWLDVSNGADDDLAYEALELPEEMLGIYG